MTRQISIWARFSSKSGFKRRSKRVAKEHFYRNGTDRYCAGEIYHYTVRTKKGYENKYSLTQLRTIQDWIVRKQLSGTPGVAEVSGWEDLSNSTK